MIRSSASGTSAAIVRIDGGACCIRPINSDIALSRTAMRWRPTSVSYTSSPNE